MPAVSFQSIHVVYAQMQKDGSVNLFCTHGPDILQYSMRSNKKTMLCCIIYLTCPALFSVSNYHLDFLGLAVRRHVVPVFEDIMQFLDYVKLDEPIIGE